MKLICGDCLEKMKDIPDNSVDMVLTDPPYGIGFMGRKWDSLPPGKEVFLECLRVLKPGGHLLSFGGTRTYHKMACAVEDAGFEIRDMIEWVYGTGMPKSLAIGKAVDKKLGNERKLVGENPANRPYCYRKGETSTGWKSPPRPNITKGNSPWEGWGTALKPAHEPICMARKPLSEKRVAENCLKWGTGGINIDGSRIPLNGEPTPKGSAKRVYKSNKFTKKKIYGNNRNTSDKGRFPANLIHDNSKDVRECFPETKSGNGDFGNAARYFKSIIYQPKVSRKERGKGNNQPTVKPIALMEYLIIMFSREGQVICDPFMGSGTTGIACINLNRHFIGIEIDEDTFKIAQERINNA